jgi:geranylgeranyl pyrophosphate synthase|tara:strand:+ start:1411 stop:2280 length:870 start_codon:yes stop_codon:yes gene_type:complete
MKKKLNKVAKDINLFLKKFLLKQKKSNLLNPMIYGLLPGGKKIRSKLLVDVGKIFNINYYKLIQIGAAVECIHAYSLIHDDLPCMDNDKLRRGKLSTHAKFGESTAILAGNSLLTIAFEILSHSKFKLDYKTKISLINLLSKCSGHSGIAGGQYSDLQFEGKRQSLRKIVDMQINKTGKLFSFCCIAPVIISKKNKYIDLFDSIGLKIGLLFQIADDLIDHSGNSKKAGKKTRKDLKKGKATLISLLGYKNTVKYGDNLKLEIFSMINKLGVKTKDLKDTINYILTRSK